MNKQDIGFAQAMIEHHKAAISMSANQWSYGQDRELKDFALRVFSQQSEEVQWLEKWLQQNGEAPTKPSPGMKM